MSGGGVVTIASAIVAVAFVSVAVTHPETANIIKALGNAFSSALASAKN